MSFVLRLTAIFVVASGITALNACVAVGGSPATGEIYTYEAPFPVIGDEFAAPIRGRLVFDFAQGFMVSGHTIWRGLHFVNDDTCGFVLGDTSALLRPRGGGSEVRWKANGWDFAVIDPMFEFSFLGISTSAIVVDSWKSATDDTRSKNRTRWIYSPEVGVIAIAGIDTGSFEEGALVPQIQSTYLLASHVGIQFDWECK